MLAGLIGYFASGGKTGLEKRGRSRRMRVEQVDDNEEEDAEVDTVAEEPTVETKKKKKKKKREKTRMEEYPDPDI